MTPDVRQEALAVLTELAALAPDVRLGQLMAHLGFLGEDQVERSLWDIEDDELLAVLHRHRSELVAREQNTSNPYMDTKVKAPPRNSRLDSLRFGARASSVERPAFVATPRGSVIAVAIAVRTNRTRGSGPAGGTKHI